jgi:predicted RNA-binding Zn ribbon-like protein
MVDTLPKTRSRNQNRRQPRSKADFRFDDARLCFAFAGTLADRGTDSPFERLNNTVDLTRWCVESGCVAEPPSCTEGDLVRAKQLRESLQRIGESLARRRRPQKKDLEIINQAASLAPLTPSLRPDGRTVEWRGRGIDAILSTIARDLIEISASHLRDHVRICSNSSCGIPFVDTSRAGTRRWCSMKTCGALVKKRMYRARKREAHLTGA